MNNIDSGEQATCAENTSDNTVIEQIGKPRMRPFFFWKRWDLPHRVGHFWLKVEGMKFHQVSRGLWSFSLGFCWLKIIKFWSFKVVFSKKMCAHHRQLRATPFFLSRCCKKAQVSGSCLVPFWVGWKCNPVLRLWTLSIFVEFMGKEHVVYFVFGAQTSFSSSAVPSFAPKLHDTPEQAKDIAIAMGNTCAMEG